MLRTMFHAKIHRATVTAAELHYVGSITIDADLLDAAGILVHEQVDVVDITNGARLTTYTLEGARGSGVIQMNGAAAHLVHTGDLAIIMAYGTFTEAEARDHLPRAEDELQRRPAGRGIELIAALERPRVMHADLVAGLRCRHRPRLPLPMRA